MSIFGLTKGTELEKLVQGAMQAEANGTMMYYALARLAKEQGMDEVAEKFIASANQEAVHAGFYAILNGKYPQDFWSLARTLQQAEESGEQKVSAMAAKFREAGLTEAADEMEIFAKEEGHHGAVLKEILDKYGPDTQIPAGATVYVCPVCGYEYIGDINKEPDDYTCPLCGQPKTIFKKK
ncbi:MAG: rubrerythrin [Anaerovibrio sp.]|uniref:ferritin family protein n=1 Tax=Anaerovibrio sp. TaxID=1872532 RepID=UPI0025CB8E1A|nr:ferritin family protein [Anaerovibrio sp.]MCR5175776.1 rubrerythrin [Anaerovibrio sp.]